jgi:hypothetical protein
LFHERDFIISQGAIKEPNEEETGSGARNKPGKQREQEDYKYVLLMNNIEFLICNFADKLAKLIFLIIIYYGLNLIAKPISRTHQLFHFELRLLQGMEAKQRLFRTL